MDKYTADCLISKYSSKIFGFALSKTRDYSQAEELAAEISCLMSSTLIPRIIDILLANDTLKPLTPQQKKAVLSVMVCRRK